MFGHQAVFSFLANNNLVAIIRAHELQPGGYAYHFNGQECSKDDPRVDKSIPPVITVFSAPNYCDQYANLAAHLLISENVNDFEVTQCHSVDHPAPLSRSRSKSIEIENHMRQVFPFLPVNAQLFERILEVAPKKTVPVSPLSSSLDLEDDEKTSSSEGE